MNRQYRICIIIPPGNPHAACFTECALLLKHSLSSLGYDCDLTLNELSPARTNIILGYHLVNDPQSLVSYTYIPWQLEQLYDTQQTFSAVAETTLRNATAVWDYSPENIAFLARRGIAAQHVPLGFHPVLQQIRHAPTKDIDILFYGSIAGRRQEILAGLKAINDISTVAVFGVYGAKRDELIARAKIVLNIHYYPTQIFEAVRVSYLFNNQCCVVSESSEIYPYPGVECPRVPFDEIIPTCRRLLDSTENGWRRSAAQTFEEFKKCYQMTQLLKPVL